MHGASIGGGGGGGGAPHRPGRELRTLEDGRGELQIPGLTEVLLATQSDAQEACRRGAARRRTGANAIHADSSRSHAVLRLSVRAALDDTPLAKLNLVDLAGSERASGAWAAAAAAAAATTPPYHGRVCPGIAPPTLLIRRDTWFTQCTPPAAIHTRGRQTPLSGRRR